MNDRIRYYLDYKKRLIAFLNYEFHDLTEIQTFAIQDEINQIQNYIEYLIENEHGENK